MKATSASTHNNSGREGGPNARRRRAVRRGQCARTSPCAHARHMARRLALLVLLAATVARRPRSPSSSQDISDSEPDPFILWDDYDESRDTTPRPRIRTTPITKVILRGKGPKVNVTVKNSGEDKKVVKTTNINIESHTNFIVTKSPPLKPNGVTKRPELDGQYILVQAPEEYPARRTTKKPTTRRPPSTRRPTTRRSSTTRRPTTRPARRTPKPTKAPTKKTTCPPKNPGWLSSFFQSNKLVKKTPKKPAKSGWYIGRSTLQLAEGLLTLRFLYEYH